MQDQSSAVSLCPSFSNYSSNNELTDIAARVVDQEAREATPSPHDHVDDDFEFVLLRAHPDDSSVNGNDGFISPAFPLFNRDLLLDHHDGADGEAAAAAAAPSLFSLEKLMLSERDDRNDDGGGSSSSSSESDELEGVPEGTYCVWSPKLSPSAARCKKSNSTGSSSPQFKRHRWLPLRDLLRRCRSDGKQSLVFLAPNRSGGETNNSKRKEGEKEDSNKGETKTVNPVKAREAKVVSAHELFYVMKKGGNGHPKRKSYLPYRRDLVGFFTNTHLAGMGKSFSPF